MLCKIRLYKTINESISCNIAGIFYSKSAHSALQGHSLQTHQVDSTLKQRGNNRFHVVSMWKQRGVFVGL